MSKTIKFFDFLISALVFLTMVVMIFFAFLNATKGTIHLWNEMDTPDLAFEVMLLVTSSLVFVKAYRILVSYLVSHHVDVKQLVKIAVIASIMDVIFNLHHNEIAQTVVLALFAIAMTLIYVIYGEKLDILEKNND